MTDRLQIVSDPAVLGGKPCVAGTRISAEHVLRELAAGATTDELVADYPSLTLGSIRAVLLFAAEALEYKRVQETVA